LTDEKPLDGIVQEDVTPESHPNATDSKGDQPMSKTRVEYIWIDGSQPTQKLRSKTRVIDNGAEPPIWGFDGSSTNQAPGENSDCVLKPVKVIPDPIRKGNDILALCEVLLPDMTPHPSNTRAKLLPVAERYADFESWFGMEQEYTFFREGRVFGFPQFGFPAPQGGYYCGIGADEIYGRPIVEAHMEACIDAGINISGLNAEVMVGQWEFQIGPSGPVDVGDEMWLARWLLYRVAEDFDVAATLDPKPVKGDWNGSGCHTNFSTRQMREDYDAIVAGAEALGRRHDLHIENYGADIEHRLTGMHETAPWTHFSYGVSDRGASVRIPWQAAVDKKGYLEDRRPNANCDPYTVARLMLETVCGSAAGDL
jgi:glutamine synthetase